MAVCPNADDDYYQVQLSPGTDLTIRLVGPDEGAPSEELRMALWGPARNFLTNTVTADEPLTYRIPVAGRHYLRVRSNGSGPRNQPYCFVVEGLSGTDLVPTDFELDTDVTRPGETVRFSFTLSNTRDEESEATNYAVFLSTDPVLSEDDTLLREVPLEPLAGLADRVEGRRFEVPADLVDGGSHHVILFVDADDDIAELSEANNIAHQPLFVSPRCTPDEAEPNNFPIDAAPATEVEGAALTSCGEGDDDWYSFTATRPLTEIQITFSDADGDLDLHVYDTDLGLVDFSDSITDDEYVSLLTSAGEEYLVLVRQHTDRTPRYTLTIE